MIIEIFLGACIGASIVALVKKKTKNEQFVLPFRLEFIPFLPYDERTSVFDKDWRYKNNITKRIYDNELLKNFIGVSKFYDISWFQTLDLKYIIYKFKTKAYSSDGYFLEMEICIINDEIDQLNIILKQ